MSVLEDYYAKYGTRITQQSERLFVEEFLYPLLGSRVLDIEPQHSFIDRTGKARRIDFAYHGSVKPLALEVNGETYHAEGIIPDEQFDDNLFRQNEILRRGYQLIRFSYSQLQSQFWRPVVMDTLRDFLSSNAPELLSEYSLTPNQLQVEALQALDFCRSARGWAKGVVVMPTGVGKTILSAMDARRHGGRALFIVHRLDILTQSMDAYRKVWPEARLGILTGLERRDVQECDVLFASKDTLRQETWLADLNPSAFQYMVIDEVHHGQSLSYQPIFQYFQPQFMLGMTATPDRVDRKDIFELFDYNNVYEIPLSEVIERGFLVPYTYIGLTDDIDYSKIRYQNQRYRVDDLERYLIVPERSQAILEAYLDENLGAGDKAIGFCVSIAHAERMAEYFSSRGVSAYAIHSAAPNRDELIQRFRQDEFQVAFTVDLFNEGVDFPNVRVLLFLRPTESKTVFLQQLGRGLRLCTGKDRTRVLDFIGNYHRANQIRKYLAKASHREDSTDGKGHRVKKIVYEYATGCEVRFDERVETLLDRQDAAELGTDKDDLREAYFGLAENLGQKPTKQDLDESGEYASRLYVQAWGTWRDFLRDVGEYTEASYHYPQGTHLGHILSILWYYGLPSREGSQFDDRYIRLRGGYGESRLGTYQRQLRYKLQAAMELGIVEDDRGLSDEATRTIGLTPLGMELRQALESELVNVDLRFSVEENGVPSTRMAGDEDTYNAIIRNAAATSADIAEIVHSVFLRMPAVEQMMRFLYQVARQRAVAKDYIYSNFFETPFVQRFCEQEGIEPASLEASRRRCPFLLNVLAACRVLRSERSVVHVDKLVLIPTLVQQHPREDRAAIMQRFRGVIGAWPIRAEMLEDEDLSILRELFGPEFLTDRYVWSDLDYALEDVR
jgi:superfamily II DNA or RNA helicase